MYGKLIEALRAELRHMAERVEDDDRPLIFADIDHLLLRIASRLEKAEEPVAAEKPTDDDEPLTDEWLESVGIEENACGDMVLDCRRGQILGEFTGGNRKWSINRHKGIDSINIEVSGRADIMAVIRLLGGPMK